MPDQSPTQPGPNPSASSSPLGPVAPVRASGRQVNAKPVGPKPVGANAVGGRGVGGPGAAGRDRERTLAYPGPVARLIDDLARLPGIGRRAAERLALHLLKAPREVGESLAAAIQQVKSQVGNCRVCSSLTEHDVCGICVSMKRDAGVVLVVEQPRDLLALEAAGMYSGVYHVLLGNLSPMDGIGPDALTVEDLVARVRDAGANARSEPVREVILGLNPTMEGDGTALYLAGRLREVAPGLKVSRLARGLPTGSSLEVVSKAVLADAVSGRRSMD